MTWRFASSALPFSKMANCLYLWTKQGAARHCKMLNTQKAWDMFDELEKSYFGNQEPQSIESSLFDEDIPFAKKFSAGARRKEEREFKEFKQNQPSTPNPDLADKLLALAELMEPCPERNKILVHAANLLIGKNIF